MNYLLAWLQVRPQEPWELVDCLSYCAPHVSPSCPYAILHIANDTPLEVAEAAYRALVK